MSVPIAFRRERRCLCRDHVRARRPRPRPCIDECLSVELVVVECPPVPARHLDNRFASDEDAVNVDSRIGARVPDGPSSIAQKACTFSIPRRTNSTFSRRHRLLRQPHGFEGVLSLLIHAAGRLHHRGSSRSRSPEPAPRSHRVRSRATSTAPRRLTRLYELVRLDPDGLPAVRKFAPEASDLIQTVDAMEGAGSRARDPARSPVASLSSDSIPPGCTRRWRRGRCPRSPATSLTPAARQLRRRHPCCRTREYARSSRPGS